MMGLQSFIYFILVTYSHCRSILALDILSTLRDQKEAKAQTFWCLRDQCYDGSTLVYFVITMVSFFSLLCYRCNFSFCFGLLALHYIRHLIHTGLYSVPPFCRCNNMMAGLKQCYISSNGL